MRTVTFKECIILSLPIHFQHYGELLLAFGFFYKNYIIFPMVVFLLHIVDTLLDHYLIMFKW